MSGNSRFLPAFPVIGISPSNAKPQSVSSSPLVSGNMASLITSNATNISHLYLVGYLIYWSGSDPKGVLTVNVSPDGVTGWQALPGFTVISPTGSGDTGSTFVDVIQTSAPWIQLVYTPDNSAPGTGTLLAYVCGKNT